MSVLRLWVEIAGILFKCPIRCVRVGNGTELGVVREGEGGGSIEDTFLLGRIEMQLDVTACLRRGRDIEPIEPMLGIVLGYAAAVVTDEGREQPFRFGEGHFDDRGHGGGHVVINRHRPLGIVHITRVGIGVFGLVGLFAASEKDR